MYAVIETGGKQYRVEVGTELEVELLDVEPGKTITLERVLLIADGTDSSIGRPLVVGAEVNAEVVRQTRGEKLISFKYRPKARSRVKKGHRQELTVLRINDITLDGKSAARAAKKAEDDAKTERMRLEEAAAAQAAKDAELAARLAVGADGGAKPGARTGTKSAGAATKATAPAEAGPTRGVAKAKAAKAKADPGSKAEAPVDVPRRGRTRPTASDATDTSPKPETPKRTRATRKDE